MSEMTIPTAIARDLLVRPAEGMLHSRHSVRREQEYCCDQAITRKIPHLRTMARFNVNYIEWRTVTTAVPAIASLCSVHPLDQAEH